MSNSSQLPERGKSEGDDSDTRPIATSSEVSPVGDLTQTEVELAPTQPVPDQASPVLEHEPSMMVAKHCQIGMRKRHEDSCLTFVADTGGHFKMMPFGLFVVADGMGGHKNGHIASKVASRAAAHHILQRIYLPMLQLDGLPTQTPIQEVMIDAVHAAHLALYDPDPDKDSGTTLTVALVLGRRLHIAHVGDTRAYLHAKGELTLLTRDHTLVRRLRDIGQLPTDDDTLGQISHILERAVGQGEELKIDAYTRSLPRKGSILLCTDGLCGFVSDETIQSVLAQEDATMSDKTGRLVTTAIGSGSTDNVTAVLVNFDI